MFIHTTTKTFTQILIQPNPLQRQRIAEKRYNRPFHTLAPTKAYEILLSVDDWSAIFTGTKSNVNRKLKNTDPIKNVEPCSMELTTFTTTHNCCDLMGWTYQLDQYGNWLKHFNQLVNHLGYIQTKLIP